jgi:integrase
MCRFGESRDDAKKDGSAYKYIYSYGTLKTYLKQLNYMVKWAKENGIKLKSIADIQLHGNEWLEWCKAQGMSSWTLTTRRAALSKICQVPYSHWNVDIPKRTRNSVVRSRDKTKALKHFSEANNRAQVVFAKCSGLRASEMKALTKDALYFDADGAPWLHITNGTKGGKHRDVKLYGAPDEIRMCIETINKCDKKVFPEYKECNNHGYRAEYCQRVYNANAREISQISDRHEKVYCRNDKKGVVYDKRALQICAEMLGHGRYQVCNLSYLY